MPVSIDDFESGELPGEPSVPEQVLVSLHSHRDLPFTRSEIAADIADDSNAVGTALSRLKDRDLVRHEGAYWAITDDLERLTAAYDLHRPQSGSTGRTVASTPMRGRPLSPTYRTRAIETIDRYNRTVVTSYEVQIRSN